MRGNVQCECPYNPDTRHSETYLPPTMADCTLSLKLVNVRPQLVKHPIQPAEELLSIVSNIRQILYIERPAQAVNQFKIIAPQNTCTVHHRVPDYMPNRPQACFSWHKIFPLIRTSFDTTLYSQAVIDCPWPPMGKEKGIVTRTAYWVLTNFACAREGDVPWHYMKASRSTDKKRTELR